MQENNFEKQVQQKMDELSLSPSAEVWQKLSVSIAKDKKDRRFFVIILLLLLMISSTVYLVFNNRPDKEYQIASSNENISDKIKSSSNTVIQNKGNETAVETNRAKNSGRNLAPTGTQQQSVSTTQNKNAEVVTNTTVEEKSVSFSERNSLGKRSDLIAVAVNKAKKVVYKKKQQLNVTVSENAPGDLADENFGTIEYETVNQNADRESKKVVHSINDFVANPSHFDIAGIGATIAIVQLSDPFVKMITTANKNEFVTEKKTELSQRRGWQFGLNFSLGAATTQPGLLGLIGTGNSDASKIVADLIQNSPGASPMGTPVVSYPSPVKTDVGILIGGFAQKKITTRSSIVLGLNFKMLNSTMMTGTKVDSTAFFISNNFSSREFFYRNGSQQKFKNHFYFIELPVSIKLQLNQQKKAPVYLTTGINLARLISSNALQFDVTSGNYYRDNAMLNKTQLSGSLGVLFSLNAYAKNPLVVGPEIQYSFSKMADAGLYKNRRYSFIGITLQKTIGKK